MPADSVDSGSSTSKRPADAEQNQRQKREKYTPVACNECKRRKIKCTGSDVCQRCQSLGLHCVYATNATQSSNNTRKSSSSFQDLQIRFAALEKQVNQLQSILMASQHYASARLESHFCAPSTLHETKPDAGSLSLSQRGNPVHSPSFIGPTNSLYSLDVGKSSLQNMGVQADSEQRADEPSSAISTPRHSPKPQPRSNHVLFDTLLCIGRDEAFRLIAVYAEELEPIYPFIDMSKATGHLELVLNHLKTPATIFRSGPPKLLGDCDERDSDILMLILASSLIIEGLGQSAVAEYMVDVVDTARSKRTRTTPANVKDVLILAMMSVYYFHCDQEVLAWRIIGGAARAALEIGLHRTESMMKTFPDRTERAWAVKLFWCVYILDRRWALGTGMPCAINASDIDPDLPEPDDKSPYLQRLIAYASISSKVSNLVNRTEKLSAKARRDEIAYLDFKIEQWSQAIPPELQMPHPTSHDDDDEDSQPRGLHRLRVLLYVRANHLRILIHRHSLLSAISLTENLTEAQCVVDIARDTIQVLAHLNRTTDIYQTQQACFNYFLLAPLAALFLAVCHGPTYFSESCRAEFYTALDLVKGFSSKSCVSRRLWNTIRVLKRLGPKLGVTPPPAAADDETQQVGGTGAMQAGSNLSCLEPDSDGLQWIASDEFSDIANQMNYDLEGLYEVAAGGNAAGTSDPLNDTCSLGFSGADVDVSKALESLF